MIFAVVRALQGHNTCFIIEERLSPPWPDAATLWFAQERTT